MKRPGARTVEIPFSSNAAALDDAEKGSQLPQKKYLHMIVMVNNII